MSNDRTYDIILVGGGLAGLSCSLLLRRRGYKVLLIEKESYPRHKVCGEYISMESWPFLERLGVKLGDMNLPNINRLVVTDTKGNEIKTDLPQGGFGISRYKIDDALATLALESGVDLLLNKKVDSIKQCSELFEVQVGSDSYISKVVCGTWGKRSKLDIKFKRFFTLGKKEALDNFIGVKYHIKYAWPEDTIGLHNFTDGYCGISKIEDDKCCLCYLTTAAALQRCGSDIKQLEQQVLMKNPWLQKIFTEATFLYDAPLTIAQINFQKREQVLDHVLLLGDAAGVITPLCGNGMSMAMHAAVIADLVVDDFLQGRSTRQKMEDRYTSEWQRQFAARTAMGRFIQANFGKDRATALFIKAMKWLPFIRKAIIKRTSGKPF